MITGLETQLISPTASLPGANTVGPKNQQQLEKAASDFEAVFLQTMVELMFEGLDMPAPFGAGSSEKTFRSLIIEETAKDMAKNGGLGLKSSIMNGMLSIQEGS